jgi:uncharacterized protein (TIGR02145 family)
MSTQITSTNYNNQNCTVTLYSATGNTIPYTNATQISLGTQTIPFTYSSTTVSDEYGVFSCFFSDFNTTCTVSQLTPPDGDGNRYKTIKIGNQIWMSENLRTRFFADGTPLDNPGNTVISDAVWSAANGSTTRYWTLVNGSSQNTGIYGLLYNQYAVLGSTSGASLNVTLCPSGWRVPSDGEFSTLNTFLGGFSLSAGTQIKSTTLWSSNGNGNNTSGFNGVPAGNREPSGGEANFGARCWWWSISNGITWGLVNSTFSFNRNTGVDQKNGFSVRCLKNS